MKKIIINCFQCMIFTIPSFTQGVNPITIEKKGIRKHYMQNNQSLERKELKTVLTNYTPSGEEYKIARRNGSIGVLLVGGGCLVIGASSLYDTMKDLDALDSGSGDFSNGNAGPYLIGCGIALAGIPFLLISNSHFNKSINLYNSQNSLGSLSTTKLNFSFTPGRAGLVLHF